MAEIKIALAGNPNCGKTTLFNALTGSSQYVGNWPGVTVEKKEGHLKGNKEVFIQDLPGIYSLSPYTLEEVVTRRYLVDERPDVILNIIDGTNIERNLYLTTQLIELGIPTVVAVNMMDLVKKNGDVIDTKKLGQALGCKVVEMSALKNEGAMDAAKAAIALAKEERKGELPHVFGGSVEHAIAHIEESIESLVDARAIRWMAIKVFERDEKVLARLALSDEVKAHIEQHIADCETECDDDAESIITNQRYEYIQGLVSKSVKKKRKPGELSVSDKIDKIVTNRFLALPIFAALIFIMYYISVTTIGTAATDWTNDVLFGEIITGAANSGLEALGVAGWLQSLIVDGIIGGVGTVLGFVPQMLMIFFFLSLLEDSGYMARVAFIMDRIFRRFGLSGKSFIPMLIGTGCGVPAVMAARTIEEEKDRRMTIMLSTFMPCSAKFEIIAMIATIFFPGSAFVAPAMYFLGIAVIILSGIALKKTKAFAGEPAPFVMELPAYHIPSFRGVLLHMWERAKAFIIKAGTIIFTACVVIWFLSNFSFAFEYLDGDIESSMLQAIGSVLAWIFKPVGFGDWKGAVSVISALMAKEQAVGTLGVLAGAGEAEGEIEAAISTMFGGSALVGLSFMLLNCFNAPCVAAIAATLREMGSKAWGWFAVIYQLCMGYFLAFEAYQLGGWMTGVTGFGIGQVIAIIFLLVAVFFIIRPAPKVKTESKLAVDSI